MDHVVEESGRGRSWGGVHVVLGRRDYLGYLGGFGLGRSRLDGYSNWKGIDGGDGWRGMEWLMSEGM